MARKCVLYVVQSVRFWSMCCGNVRDAFIVKLRDLLGESFKDYYSIGIVLVCEVWEKGYCVESQTLLSLNLSPQLGI